MTILRLLREHSLVLRKEQLGKRRLIENFRRLAKDLTLIGGYSNDVILCPLCLRSFNEQAISSQNDDAALSEEHIIPGEVGGKWVTVTCKRCNNSLGSSVDSHLGKKLRDQAGAEGKKKFRIALNIGDAILNCDIRWPKDPSETIIMEAVGRSSNPAHVQKAIQYLQSGVDTIGMKLREQAIGYRYKVALLKIAYLGLFNHFGYRYILNSRLDPIRKQICNYQVKQSFLDDIAYSIDPSQALPTPFVVVPNCRILSSPSCLVLIRLSGEVVRNEAVFMPLPIAGSENMFNELTGVKQKLADGTLTLTLNYTVTGQQRAA